MSALDFILNNPELSAGMIAFLIIVIIWEAVWKLIAMWKSARKGHVVWFIVLAVFNTVGILPILYLYLFSKIDLSEPDKKIKSKRKSKKKKK